MPPVETALGWHRLDRRMLLVHPVREVVRFLPAVIGLLLFGRSSESGGIWGLGGGGVPVGLGGLRYLTTSYRLTGFWGEGRDGVVNKQGGSAPPRPVRPLDVRAPPIHRALGLVTLRIGTGQSSAKGEERLILDGLSSGDAAALRQRLLHASPTAEVSSDGGED